MASDNHTALPGEINYPLVDRWTVGHAALGSVLGLIKMPAWATITIAVGWEIIERPLKNQFPDMFPHSTQDTFANSLMDAIAVIGAWGLMRSLPER